MACHHKYHHLYGTDIISLLRKASTQLLSYQYKWTIIGKLESLFTPMPSSAYCLTKNLALNYTTAEPVTVVLEYHLSDRLDTLL